MKPKPKKPADKFYRAIEKGDVEGVAKHLPDLANVPRKERGVPPAAPLMLAIGGHHTEIVRMLLDAGDELDGAQPDFSALHFACKDNLLDIATLLVERGAPIKNKDVDGKTPYLRTRHPEIRAMLRAAGAPGFSGRGGKPLHPKISMKDPIDAEAGRIAFDRDGKVWIASHHGFYCQTGERIARYTFERDIKGTTGWPAWRVSGIGRGPGNTIYVGTGDGLVEISESGFTRFDGECAEVIEGPIMATAPDGRVYMVTRPRHAQYWPMPQYITAFDGETFTHVVAPEGITITCLAFDPDGGLVLGGGDTIAIQRGDDWQLVRDDRFDSVHDLIVERGVIWLGVDQGVVEYRDGRTALHDTGYALRLAKVGDDIYFADFTSVKRLRDGSAIELSGGEVSDLQAGPDGRLWILVGSQVVTV